MADSSAPPGLLQVVRQIGAAYLWLLGRPFATGLAATVFGTVALLGTAIGLWLAGLVLPALVALAAGLGAAYVTAKWLLLRRAPPGRDVLYLARFDHEAASDAGPSAQHRYLLAERLRENALLREAFEIRLLETMNREQAARVARYTKQLVISGHVIAAGSGSRWEAVLSVPWPDTTSGVSFFHSPLKVFHHSSGRGDPTVDPLSLGVDPDVPIEFLVSETLAAKHVDAIEGTTLVIAGARAELRDDDVRAEKLSQAARAFVGALPPKVEALDVIEQAVLAVKRGGAQARAKATADAENEATRINDDDLWSFVLAAYYVGEFEGWSIPDDRERVARAALAAHTGDPDNEAHYTNAVGSALLARGRIQDAKKMLEASLEIPAEQQRAGAHFHLGVIAFNAGQFQAAHHHYSQAVQEARVPSMLTNLGDAKIMLGLYDEGRELYREALVQDPFYGKAIASYCASLAHQAGKPGVVFPGGFMFTKILYPLLVVDGTAMSRRRWLRPLARRYLRRHVRHVPWDPRGLLLLGLTSIYRREFRDGELFLGAIAALPFLDSARAAALVPVAQALNGDMQTAVANLDWLLAEFTKPTVPVAQVDPQTFRAVAIESLATAFRIEPSLCSLPVFPQFAQEVGARFPSAPMP